jgi:hypothetical protein
VLTAEQLAEKTHAIDVENQKAQEKFVAEDQKLDDEAANKKNEADKRQRERIYKSQVEADNRYLAEVKRLEDEGYILHETAEEDRQKGQRKRIPAACEAHSG